MNLLSVVNSISIEHPKILTRNQLSVTMDSEWVKDAITRIIVLCTHNGGGVGKTTFAFHVAGGLQTKLSRTLLIDCDDWVRSLSDISDRPNILSLCSGSGSL